MSRLDTFLLRFAVPALLSFAFLLGGCGVSSWVTAPDSKYPISMSDGIRDQSGELVATDKKTKVGTFEKHYKACSMLWRLISFTGDKDISDAANQQIADAKGDAITNLTVESSGTVWNIITFIGIFPDCGNVRLNGDIVKVTPAVAPPAALPPAPAKPETSVAQPSASR